MSVFDVCRLCSSKSNLVWVFNREIKTDQKMEEVIFVTTGVEIHKKDMISQKICDKCIQFTTTVFSFRKKCAENDKQLKDLCMKLLKIDDMKIPNTDVTIKHEKCTLKNKSKKQEPVKPPYKVHPTIADVFRKHPGLKLPTPCLTKDVAPFVSMPLDEVENYFPNGKLNFDEPVKVSLKSKRRVANFDCDSGSAASNLVVNAKIISGENEDEDNGVVRPIKIRIYSKDYGDKAINSNSDASTKNLNNNHDYKVSTSNICENAPSINPVNTPEHTRLHQKRKFSEVDESSNMENGKEPTASMSIIDKSAPLHICDICNSVYYSSKDLKQHQNKHCQFCRMKFLNLENKLLHLENGCIIKKTIENLPDVEVQKIECDLEIRRKYPEAFSDFPALKIDTNIIHNKCKNPETLETAESSSSANVNSLTADLKRAKSHITAEDTVDVINISSDDDDVVAIIQTTSTDTRMSNSISTSTGTRMGSTVFEKAASSQAGSQVVRTSVARAVNNIPAITPDIRIKNNSVLNSIDLNRPDAEVLRKLLIGKPLKLTAETNTQTCFPTNQFIRVYSDNLTAELKHLKLALHVHKVPVEIKRGPFGVSYNYEINPREPKRLHLWNDLRHIDIKTNKKRRASSLRGNPIQINSQKSNIPTPKPLNIKTNVVSTSLQSIGNKLPLVDNVVEAQNSSISKPQAVVTFPGPILTVTDLIVSNIMGLQHGVNQYSSASKPQAITTAQSPVVSCTTLSQQSVHQNSSITQPQTITTPSTVSSHTNSSVSNVALPQQNLSQYTSASKPPAIITKPSAQSSHTNFVVSDSTLPQQNVRQYSSNSRPQTITTSSLVSSHINSLVSNNTFSKQNFHQYFSTSKPQTNIASPSPVSSNTNSFVSNITLPQQNAHQYISASKPQTITTSSLVSSHTNSFISNITLPQKNVHDYSSTSIPQTIVTSSPVSLHPNPFVSNNTLSQQDVQQYTSTSKSQTIVTTTNTLLSHTNPTVSNSMLLKQNDYRRSSLCEPQEVSDAPIHPTVVTDVPVSNISVAQQGVYQNSSTPKAQEVSTTPISASMCTNSIASNITICRQGVYSPTSEPEKMPTTSASASMPTSSQNLSSLTSGPPSPALSTIPSVPNVSVSQQDTYQYPSGFQEVTTTFIPVSTCTSLSVPNSVSQQGIYQLSSTVSSAPVSNISVPQQDTYQYLSTSEPQFISASTCTTSSASNISTIRQGVYHNSSTSTPQEVVAASPSAPMYTSSSVSNASVLQQDVHQYSLTSEPQGVTINPIPALTSPVLSVSNISVPQQDIYRYPSTSEPQEVTTTCTSASTCAGSSVSNISTIQQDVYHNSSTSTYQEIVAASSSAPMYITSTVSNASVPQQDIHQSSLTSESQGITITSILASTSPVPSISNISVAQQDIYRYPSTSEPQEVTTACTSASTCAGSSVSNVSTIQQGVDCHSSSSKPQEVVAASLSAPSYPNSSVSNVFVPKDVRRYSLTSEPQGIPVNPIPALTCAVPLVSNISDPEQDNDKYLSNSEPQSVTTITIPALTCTNSSAPNISVPLHGFIRIKDMSELT